MFRKTSKSLVILGVLLVFSLLLASCQSLLASAEEMERSRAIEAWGANLTAQGEVYFEEMEKNRAIEAWGDNLTGQGERYFEVMAQASVPWIELRSDVPALASVFVAEAFKPGIEIRRTRLDANTYLIIYTVKSDRPAWVVFHADDSGSPGQILRYVFVESGTHKIARTEVLGEISSAQVHVMLHEDHGIIGLFEYPGLDGPTLVEDDIVEELCFCPF